MSYSTDSQSLDTEEYALDSGFRIGTYFEKESMSVEAGVVKYDTAGLYSKCKRQADGEGDAQYLSDTDVKLERNVAGEGGGFSRLCTYDGCAVERDRPVKSSRL